MSIIRFLGLMGVCVTAGACAATPSTDERLSKSHGALYIDSQKQATTGSNHYNNPIIVSPDVSGTSPTYGLTCLYSRASNSSWSVGPRLGISKSTNFGSTWSNSIHVQYVDGGSPAEEDPLRAFHASATGRPNETAVVSANMGYGPVWHPQVRLGIFTGCDQSVTGAIIWPNNGEDAVGHKIRDVSVANNPDEPGVLAVAWIDEDSSGQARIKWRRVFLAADTVSFDSSNPYDVADSEDASTVTAFYTIGGSTSDEAFAWSRATNGEDLAEAITQCVEGNEHGATRHIEYRWAPRNLSSAQQLADDENFTICVSDDNNQVLIPNMPRVRALSVRQGSDWGRMVFAYNKSTSTGMGAFIKQSGVSPTDPLNLVEMRVKSDCTYDPVTQVTTCTLAGELAQDIGVGLAAWKRGFDGEAIIAVSTMHFLEGSLSLRPAMNATDDASSSSADWSLYSLLGSEFTAEELPTNANGYIVGATHLRDSSATSQSVAWEDRTVTSDQQIHTQYVTPF